MFLIKKKKKPFHASGKYAKWREKNLSSDTCYESSTKRKNLSSVDVYSMNVAKGLYSHFKWRHSFGAFELFFFFHTRSICSTFQCRQHGALLLDALKKKKKKEQLPGDLYTLKNHVIPQQWHRKRPPWPFMDRKSLSIYCSRSSPFDRSEHEDQNCFEKKKSKATHPLKPVAQRKNQFQLWHTF